MNPSPAQMRWTGLFLACGIASTAVAVVLLVGSKLLRQRRALVCELQSESVSGLSKGAKVLLRGIEVGNIVAMEFDPHDPERILVNIEVNRSAPVYKDATATMEIFGITGLKYLELVPGDQKTGIVAEGDHLKILPSRTDAIVDKIDTMARTSTQVMRNIDSLTGRSRQIQVDSILSNLRHTTRDLSAMASGFRALRLDAQVARVMGHVERTTSKMDSTMAAMEPSRSLARFDTAVGSISSVARRADLMLSRSQGDIYRSVEDLSITMRNLSDFSQSIRDNPGALLRSGGKVRDKDGREP